MRPARVRNESTSTSILNWSPGVDRAAELGALDAGEDDQFLVPVENLGQHDDAAGLPHGLDHQNARHDRMAGEMSLEKKAH